MALLEIERKFLVKNDGFLKDVFKTYRIVQGYVARESGNSVRVRIRDNQGFLTIKGPSFNGGLSRFEWEKEIDIYEAKCLIRLCNRLIEKERHLVKAGALCFEVDVFHGLNEGLVTAEIELPEESAAFAIPEWLGDEVTGIKKYYNSSLSERPYCSW